jgi:uncharacterized membrane protein
MKKWILLIIGLVLMATSATALDNCEERREIQSNCTMLTPTISCTTYNYTVFHQNGSVSSDGDLNNHDNQFYSFNFTESAGEYIIILCDGTSREIRVTDESEENKMIVAILILLPMILGIFLLVGAVSLSNEHPALKIALFLLSPTTFFISAHMGVQALIKFYEFNELIDTFGTTIYWMAIIFSVLVIYFLIYLFIKMVHHMAQKKKERLEY